MSLLRRELIINVSFLLLANLLIKPYYIFFVERNIQNDAGTEAWGLYFTLFSLSMIPQIVLDLGISSYISRTVSGDKSQFQLLFQKSILLKAFLAVAFLVVFIIISYIAGYFQKHLSWLLWIATNQMLLSLILFLRAFIAGNGDYRLDSFLSVADKLIFIALFLAGWYTHKHPIDRFLMIQSWSLLLSAMIAGILVLKSVRPVRLSITPFSEMKALLIQGIPYAFIFILMVLYCRLEPVWIDVLRVDGAKQSGHYAAAYRLLDAANMMGFLFAGLLLPMFSKLNVSDIKSELQSLFDLAFAMLMSLSVSIAVILAVSNRSVMHLLYTEDHGNILYIVIVNLIPLSFNYLIITLITAIGQLYLLHRWFLVSILINIVFNIVLTSKFGAPGAAWAACITQCCTSIWLIYLVQKQRWIVLTLRHFINLGWMILISLVISWCLYKLIFYPLWFLAVSFMVIFLIFFTCKLISLKAILTIFKHKISVQNT